MLAVLSMVVLSPSGIDAKVKGRCKDCHDMHALSGDPSPAMTKGDCLSCHGQEPSEAENIVLRGLARIPQVLHQMPEGDLAGGNFIYAADGFNPDYSTGHNVAGISRQEDPPLDMPPGFLGSVVIPGGTGPSVWLAQNQLTCAGTWGCHGDRNVEDPTESLHGAHHADDSVIDGSTVGRSYRYLLGVTGAEHQDWEYLATVDDHNGYKGDTSFDTKDTISYFCGQCHGKFHPHSLLGGSGVGDENVWHRHPSDISFGTVHAGYSGSEYQDYTTYSLEAPVAYVDPAGDETVVDSNSIIMCLSCHRAHGSPFPDTLRWNVTQMVTGQNRSVENGCFTCHSRK